MMGDIAIVQLDKPSSGATSMLDSGGSMQTGDMLIVIGYGSTENADSSDVLKYAVVPAVSTDAFNNWIKVNGSQYGVYGNYMEADHFLAGMQKSDSCPGDRYVAVDECIVWMV